MDPSTRLTQIIQEMRVEINRLEKENHDLRVKLISISQTATSSGRESEDEMEEGACGQSPGTIHGGVPVDSTPAVQEHQGNVMIVRRYAISPSVHSYAANDPWKAGNRLSSDGPALAWSSTRKQDNEEKMLAADAYSINSSSQKAPSDHSFVCSDYAGSPTVKRLQENSKNKETRLLTIKLSRQRMITSRPRIVTVDVVSRYISQLRSEEFITREKTKTVSFQLPGDRSSGPKNSNSLKHSANQTTNQPSIIAEKDV
ncbi:putative coiled-coil domain-containing protein 195 [Meriones unguiculatus]|uniref:putative coiled-coil domain-containing protein 195 n=1 Tax=Meriones unguiculatus TaxID=10047 RepID=UPI00293F4BC2|nr:putative coiled-coil domain-containing protein 195 [Meriones unguiculatus]